MSAIVGVLHLDGRPVDGSDLDAMLGSVAHRGPDASTTWSKGPVGLGQAMLRTTPESLSELPPLPSRDGSKIIVADARIDNRDEILSGIDVSGADGREMSDSAVILACYEAWGERCAERLLGDFAFAIWDAERATLFCARDVFGVRPLYMHFQRGRLFAFASEIKALLTLREIPRRLNETRLGDYLIGSFDDREITFFRDIQRLAPARCASVNLGGMRSRSFWSLEPLKELEITSGQACAEALRDRFEAAVRCRMRSAYPVGSLLSGGLDSSSVTCMADTIRSKLNGHPLHTFSWVFGAVPDSDERFYISKVLAHREVRAHLVNVDGRSPLAGVEDLLGFQDEPLVYPTVPLDWSLYSEANTRGVRVVLHGNGGDTVLSHGEMYVAQLARSGHWLAAAKALRALQRNFGQPYLEMVLRYLVAPLAPGPLKEFSRRLAERRREVRHSIVNDDFARRVGLAERLKASRALRVAPVGQGNELHARAVRSATLQYLLETRDKSAAPNRVDPRYPFYDRRLVELCVSLPAQQKIHDGWTRIAMRRAMEGILPSEVQWRDHKTPLFPHPMDRLIVLDRARLEELVRRFPEELGPYVNQSAVLAAFQRLMSRRPSGDTMSRWSDAVQLWRVAVLSLWLRNTDLRA